MKNSVGYVFQKETKYYRGKLPGGYLVWQSKPETYKSYPGTAETKLVSPQKEGGMPLWEAIRKRRSVRDFMNEPISQADISQLLWATQGITKKLMGSELRAVPSAGALYPVETYLIIHNVEDVEPGIYHYNIQNHSLEQISAGDFRAQIAEAALDQEFLAEANVVFVWTAVFERSKWKYKERAYRYVYLDAGHIAQNLALAAVSLGLGSCQIAALYDDEVNELLGVDGREESVVYLTAIGKPR
jgi:SagB-type dehydrogenase family enzyme